MKNKWQRLQSSDDEAILARLNHSDACCDIGWLHEKLGDYYRAGLAYADCRMSEKVTEMAERLGRREGRTGRIPCLSYLAADLLRKTGESPSKRTEYEECSDTTLECATETARGLPHLGERDFNAVICDYAEAGQYQMAIDCVPMFLAQYPEEAWCCHGYLADLAYLVGNWSDALRYREMQMADTPWASRYGNEFEVRALIGAGRYADAQAACTRMASDNYHSWRASELCQARIAIAKILDRTNDIPNIVEELEHRLCQENRVDIPLRAYRDCESWSDLERLCREKGLLEVAAHLYQAANKDEEAARIYEEIAGAESGEKPTSSPEAPATETSGRQCPSCGAAVEEGAKYCDDCGHRLSPVCPKCGAEVKAGKKFCKQCGSKVE